MNEPDVNSMLKDVLKKMEYKGGKQIKISDLKQAELAEEQHSSFVEYPKVKNDKKVETVTVSKDNSTLRKSSISQSTPDLATGDPDAVTKHKTYGSKTNKKSAAYDDFMRSFFASSGKENEEQSSSIGSSSIVDDKRGDQKNDSQSDKDIKVRSKSYSSKPEEPLTTPNSGKSKSYGSARSSSRLENDDYSQIEKKDARKDRTYSTSKSYSSKPDSSTTESGEDNEKSKTVTKSYNSKSYGPEKTEKAQPDENSELNNLLKGKSEKEVSKSGSDTNEKSREVADQVNIRSDKEVSGQINDSLEKQENNEFLETRSNLNDSLKFRTKDAEKPNNPPTSRFDAPKAPKKLSARIQAFESGSKNDAVKIAPTQQSWHKSKSFQEEKWKTPKAPRRGESFESKPNYRGSVRASSPGSSTESSLASFSSTSPVTTENKETGESLDIGNSVALEKTQNAAKELKTPSDVKYMNVPKSKFEFEIKSVSKPPSAKPRERAYEQGRVDFRTGKRFGVEEDKTKAPPAPKTNPYKKPMDTKSPAASKTGPATKSVKEPATKSAPVAGGFFSLFSRKGKVPPKGVPKAEPVKEAPKKTDSWWGRQTGAVPQPTQPVEAKPTLKELAMKPAPIRHETKSQKILQSEIDRDAILALFEFYDQDQNGYLKSHQLRNLMSIFGDKFTDKEFTQLENQASSNGKFYFDKLYKFIIIAQ